MKILVDRNDAQVFCRLWAVAGMDFFPLKYNLTGIQPVGTREDFYQGGLSCSVFTEESVNFAFAKVKIDTLKDFDSIKRLADTLQF